MSATMKLLGIDHLSPGQKVDLALEIWESLGESRPTGALTDEQKATISRRDQELNAHPEAAMSWEQIRTSIEGQP